MAKKSETLCAKDSTLHQVILFKEKIGWLMRSLLPRSQKYKNGQKDSVNNGQRFYALNYQILCNGTLHAVGKISVKNAKRYDKKCRLSLISRYF